MTDISTLEGSQPMYEYLSPRSALHGATTSRAQIIRLLAAKSQRSMLTEPRRVPFGPNHQSEFLGFWCAKGLIPSSADTVQSHMEGKSF